MFFRLCLTFSILVLVYKVEGQYRFDCDKNVCKKKENACPKLDCKDGRLMKHATECGCCDICIKVLKEGEKCRTKYYGLNNGKLEQCGDGLVCDKVKRTCIPASTKCIADRAKFDNEKQYNGTRLKERPECNYFGFYKPVACIPGALCYCVDKNGTRIFGTDSVENNETMKCDCSLEINDFITNPFSREVPDGSFPRCLPSGNYDLLQCTKEVCFCMDTLSPEDNIININTSLEKLPCYNRKIHQNRLESNCWKEKEKQMALYKNESFAEVIGVDFTRCGLDGSYSPVQCMKNRCYCVNRRGNSFDGYAVDRNSNDAKKMKCDCLRDKELWKEMKEENAKILEIFKCDRLGNYVRSS